MPACLIFWSLAQHHQPQDKHHACVTGYMSQGICDFWLENRSECRSHITDSQREILDTNETILALKECFIDLKQVNTVQYLNSLDNLQCDKSVLYNSIIHGLSEI